MIGLFYAQRVQSGNKMSEPDILIHIEDENQLLTKSEVEDFLKQKNLYSDGMKFSEIDFDKIERELAQLSPIESVKVFSQLGHTWKIRIKQRKPIVRVFDNQENNFYLDEGGNMFKMTNFHSSKVLIANGAISVADSLLTNPFIINIDGLKTNSNLYQIYLISNYVCNDPFLSAQISQIYLREDGDFVLIPQIGDQIIVFGTAVSAQEVATKFQKLTTFYKEGIGYEGWNKYSEINLKFNDQIVCKKK